MSFSSLLRCVQGLLLALGLPALVHCGGSEPSRPDASTERDAAVAPAPDAASPEAPEARASDAQPGTGQDGPTSESNRGPCFGTPAPAAVPLLTAYGLGGGLGSESGVIELGDRTVMGWRHSPVSGPTSWKQGELVTNNGALAGVQKGDRLAIDLSFDCQTFSGCKRSITVREEATGDLLYFNVSSDAKEDGRVYSALKAPIVLVPVCPTGSDRCRAGGVVTSMAVKIGASPAVPENSSGLIAIEARTFRLFVGTSRITIGGASSTCTDMGSFFNGSVGFTVVPEPDPT